MGTFFTIVGAMFVGGILCLIVPWFGIKFLIRHFLKKLGEAMAGLGGNGVPPFRITLDKAAKPEWKDAKVIDGIAAALEGVGYTRIGDFCIEELPNAQLRALVNPQTNSYGVIADLADKGAILDVACDFADHEHVTVTTAPESGLDRPEFSQLIRVDTDLAADPAAAVSLHERIVEEQRGRPTVVASADAFPKMYAAAHAREMDWRIDRGGVTAEEIRRSCEATGTEIPNDEAVEMVRKARRDQRVRQRAAPRKVFEVHHKDVGG